MLSIRRADLLPSSYTGPGKPSFITFRSRSLGGLQMAIGGCRIGNASSTPSGRGRRWPPRSRLRSEAAEIVRPRGSGALPGDPATSRRRPPRRTREWRVRSDAAAPDCVGRDRIPRKRHCGCIVLPPSPIQPLVERRDVGQSCRVDEDAFRGVAVAPGVWRPFNLALCGELGQLDDVVPAPVAHGLALTQASPATERLGCRK